MPGSKTYTSYKVNELLEHDLFDGINDMEKHKLKEISRSVFTEILKICLSLLVTSFISMFTIPTQEDEANLVFNLKVISGCIGIFIGVYLLIYIIFGVGKWILDAIFNKRLLSSEKKKAYLLFHKKIVNHIYLGVSFENKYNVYISNASNKIDDLNLDLASTYLSQSVHYFKIALDEIEDLIPPKVKDRGWREKKNAEFLEHIGFPLLNVSLVCAQRSLNRLLATECKIKGLTGSILANSNKSTIQLAYSNSIEGLFAEISWYINSFESRLERVLCLYKYLYKHNCPLRE